MSDKTHTCPIAYCSFCGKGQRQVARLIADPNRVYICDECITLCWKIINEEPATNTCTTNKQEIQHPDKPTN